MHRPVRHHPISARVRQSPLRRRCAPQRHPAAAPRQTVGPLAVQSTRLGGAAPAEAGAWRHSAVAEQRSASRQSVGPVPRWTPWRCVGVNATSHSCERIGPPRGALLRAGNEPRKPPQWHRGCREIAGACPSPERVFGHWSSGRIDCLIRAPNRGEPNGLGNRPGRVAALGESVPRRPASDGRLSIFG